MLSQHLQGFLLTADLRLWQNALEGEQQCPDWIPRGTGSACAHRQL